MGMAEYSLTLHGYCGMAIPLHAGEREECREYAARHLRGLRQEGYPVVTLEKGEEWEVREPEGAAMVPDWCGILWLRRVPTPRRKCYECGETGDWQENGYCACRCCGECGMGDGHEIGCSVAEEERAQAWAWADEEEGEE